MSFSHIFSVLTVELETRSSAYEGIISEIEVRNCEREEDKDGMELMLDECNGDVSSLEETMKQYKV